MKYFALTKTLFAGKKRAAVLISFLIFASVFTMCWIQALYDYRLRYVSTLEKYMGNADLYMQYVQPQIAEENIKKVISKTSNMPGIECVFFHSVSLWSDENENPYIVYYYPPEMASRIDFGANLQEYTGENIIQCVSSDGLAAAGDTLHLHIKNSEVKEKKSLDFQVKGTVEKNFLYPKLSVSGDVLEASSLLEEVNALFVTGEIFLTAFEEQGLEHNCYIVYKDDISSEQLENVRNVLKDYGRYQNMSEILEASEEFELAEIRHILLLPGTVLFVITIACCAVILLIMQEKMQEYSVYFLCGCSRQKIAALCFASLSLIMVIPCILNFFIIFFREKISSILEISFGTVLYSGHQILFTFVYLFSVLLITGMIELIMIAGMSPVEMYRRMTR